MIISVPAVVGHVLSVERHPNGDRLWVASVYIGNDRGPLQIVFGGRYRVQPGELVPVALPGSWASELDEGESRMRKIRRRRYRGRRSNGMLCSLAELGWYAGGPDEVAVLRGLRPGDRLSDIPPESRADFVVRPRCLNAGR